MFCLGAVLLGFGSVLNFSCVPTHRHYMILTFPMMYLWVAVLVLKDQTLGRFGTALLIALFTVHLAISASFLVYVHENHRPIRGDYGTPYSVQTP